MGCLGNSKTEDQRIDEKAQREANKKIEKQLQKERQAYKATHRLLLLGKVMNVQYALGMHGFSNCSIFRAARSVAYLTGPSVSWWSVAY